MDRRIFGLENEYGVTCTFRGQRRLSPDEVARYLFRRVVTGGHAPDRRGYFYEPTVLDKVPADAGILSEEIFGPVAPIVRFSETSEAIELANGTEYGLVSYLYSADLRRALEVAEALEAGMVGINRGVVSDPAAPFGGVKQSGLGREGGHEGLLEFTETKYIAVDW